jgi:glycosyltransferase involved in cell wall biosynthesis
VTVPDEKLVSVVTPVYNGERFLAECMESVLAQTHGNWEYLVCDNRSTDRTHDIAHEVAARDERVKVLRFEEFVPHIENWNRAMRQVSAESAYVKVVHADDKLMPECLERMVALAERHPNVGLVSAYALWQDEVRGRLLPKDVEVVSGKEIRRLTLLRKGEVFGSPTATMIRADLVRARPEFYKATFIHADTEICLDLLRDCDLGFVHDVLTFTRLHPASVTSFADRVGTWLPERIEFLLEHGPEALSEEEYDGALRRALREYSVLLGKRAIRLRLLDRRVREFHAESLSRLSSGLRAAPPRSRLLAPAAPVAAILARLLGARPGGEKRLRPIGGKPS